MDKFQYAKSFSLAITGIKKNEKLAGNSFRVSLPEAIHCRFITDNIYNGNLAVLL